MRQAAAALANAAAQAAANDAPAAQAATADAQQALADAQALSPLNQLWWRARFAYYSWHHAEYDQALRAIEECPS